MRKKYKLIKAQALKAQVKEFLFFRSPFLLYLQQHFGLKIIKLKIQKTLIHHLQMILKNPANKKVMILNQIKKAIKKIIKKIKILLKNLKKQEENNHKIHCKIKK